MLDSTINFLDQDNFQFIDNSDINDYIALGAYDKTRLEITYPPIVDIDPETNVNIVPENVALLDITDGFEFNIVDLDLSSLVDGVYKFRLLVLDVGDVQLGVKVKYFVQDYSIQECIKTKIEEILDSCEQDCESWCEIDKADAILNSAKYQASIGNFTVSQKMIEYLTSKCDICI